MANTTNLDLEKPLGTDKALVARINSNMDKIDTFAGSTNQALSHYYDTNGVLKTLNGIDVRTITEAGRYYCVGCTNLPGGTGYGYLDVYVYNANYRRLLFHEASYDAMYTTRLQNGTWQSWQQLAVIKTKTVTGTADSNGFFDTGLKTASATLVSVPSLRVNDELRYAFFATPLMNGGTPAEKMALQFKNWDGNVIGKSATITATIVYFEF